MCCLSCIMEVVVVRICVSKSSNFEMMFSSPCRKFFKEKRLPMESVGPASSLWLELTPRVTALLLVSPIVVGHVNLEKRFSVSKRRALRREVRCCGPSEFAALQSETPELEKRERAKREGERERGRGQGSVQARQREAETAITHIAVGRRRSCPGMHFQGACRFNIPKSCTTVGLFGPCSKTGRTRCT